MRRATLLLGLLSGAAGGCGSGAGFLRMFDRPEVAAVDDDYRTSVDAPLEVDASSGVLENDTGEGLEVTLRSGPAQGQLTLSADGAFVYTPAEGFVGEDSFRYRARVPGHHEDATVTLSVFRDFTVTVEPSSIAIVQGSSEDIVISLAALDDLAPPVLVTLSVTGLPAGVIASPSSIVANAGDVVTIALDTTVASPQSVWTTGSVNASAGALAVQTLPLAVRVRGAAGRLDTTLDPSGMKTIDLPAYSICNEVQTDSQGRITFAGMAYSDDVNWPAIGRLLDDGARDPSFAAAFGDPGLLILTSGFYDGGELYSLQLEADGSAVIAGRAYMFSPFTHRAVIGKITATGNVDSSYGALVNDLGAAFGDNNQASFAWAVRNGPGDRRIYGGTYGVYVVLEARLASGALDTAFGSDGRMRFSWGASPSLVGFDTDSNGGVAALGFASPTSNLSRVTPDGTLDPLFGGGDGTIVLSEKASEYVVAGEAGGTLVALGDPGGAVDVRIAQYSSSGELIATFGSAGVLVIDGGPVEFARPLLNADGSILIVGARNDTGSATYGKDPIIGRYFADGSSDDSFNGDAPYLTFPDGDADSTVYPTAWAVDGEGRVLVCAQRYEPAGVPSTVLFRVWQ